MQLAQKKPQPVRRPEKVTQLQCSGLDQEFKSIFTSSITSAFKYFPDFINRFKSQMQLILQLLYFKFTTWNDLAEPGNALQNITYCRENLDAISKLQKIGIVALDILLPYVRKKLESVEKPWLKKLVGILDTLVRVLQYVNLILFIKNGVYRSLGQRLLKVQMKFIDATKSRMLDFSIMNRQLLWNIYEGFLSSVLPFLKQTLNSNFKKIFYLYSYMNVDEQSTNCMVCNDSEITLPQTNNGCEHIACFYCMKNFTLGKDRSNCLVCGKEFTEWGGQQHN